MLVNRLARSSNKSVNKSNVWLANICLAVVIIALIVVKAVLTNAQVAVGAEANNLTHSQQQLTNQISHLKWQIAQYKSLARVQQYAVNQLDMSPIQKNIIYLPSPELPDEAP